MSNQQNRFTPELDVGLTHTQVEKQMAKHLHNEEMERITKSYQEIFRDNICTLFNLINAVLAGLILYVGSYKNLLFLGVAFSNLAIGIFQEIRAKRVLDKLSLLTETRVQVLRDGEVCHVSMNDVVLDDIMLLSTGNQVCCDAIIKEGRLEVNESNVNGESDIITKRVGDFLYSGSYIIAGTAKVQVEHVGEDNYVQTIMKDAKVLKKHKSELRDSINFIIKYIGIAIIPIGVLLFLKQHFLLDYPIHESIISTVAALIGMIPEGLVLLTSVALAVGSINLARHKTLVQELYCIETLARVDVLCLDKTGTITQGNMQVESIIHFSEEDIPHILANMMHALPDDNSTSLAIRKYVKEADDLDVIEALPFSSMRKLSAVTFAQGTYIMGAYEFIKPKEDPQIQQQIEHYSNLGNRVITLSYHPDPIQNEEVPAGSMVIGLLLLSDPIREEAPKTLQYFASQGVDIKIISGDNPVTVHEIARKAGVANADQYVDASTLHDEDIPYALTKYAVFGRVSPTQKKLMIQALKQQKHTTAMIGDGVNDVMALKEADCSIAVAQGSEAAKNIANLVLLDNNFKNMPYIVAEGRRVINNIQRAASLFLVKTIFSFILAILTLFLNSRYPFQPIQLTLISSLTIGIPSFFLALEPNHNRVKGNFVINVLSQAAPGAFMVIICTMLVSVFTYLFHYNDEVRSTMCVILTGTCSLTVLLRVSTPFTIQRKIVFCTMTTCFILAIVFLKNIFVIAHLDMFTVLVTLGGVFAIPIVMNRIYYVLHRFKRIQYRIKHAVSKK